MHQYAASTRGYARIREQVYHGYPTVRKDTQGYARVRINTRPVRGYTRIRKDTQGYTRISKLSLQVPPRIYKFPPRYGDTRADIRQYATSTQAYAKIYSDSPTDTHSRYARIHTRFFPWFAAVNPRTCMASVRTPLIHPNPFKTL